MGLADLVVLAGIEKDALGGRRLTGVDVRHDADVAIFLERMAAGHDLISVAGAPSTPRQFSECLPAVMAEGAVRLGNAVRVFALLDRVAAVVRRLEQLTRPAPRHREIG